jgi:hypothetical protein
MGRDATPTRISFNPDAPPVLLEDSAPVVSVKFAAGRESPPALRPSELIVVSGVALFLLLLTAWCLLRLSRHSLLSERPGNREFRRRVASSVDPWVEAGRRAGAVAPEPPDTLDSGDSDQDPMKPHG